MAREHTSRRVSDQRLVGDKNQVWINDHTSLANWLRVNPRQCGERGTASFGSVDGRILGLQATKKRGCAQDPACRLDAVATTPVKANS